MQNLLMMLEWFSFLNMVKQLLDSCKSDLIAMYSRPLNMEILLQNVLFTYFASNLYLNYCENSIILLRKCNYLHGMCEQLLCIWITRLQIIVWYDVFTLYSNIMLLLLYTLKYCCIKLQRVNIWICHWYYKLCHFYN